MAKLRRPLLIALALTLIATLGGCGVDARKLKTDQKKRSSGAGSQVKDQTGEDLGTTKENRPKKIGLPRVPTDP